jgi:hypothetical protein
MKSTLKMEVYVPPKLWHLSAEYMTSYMSENRLPALISRILGKPSSVFH